MRFDDTIVIESRDEQRKSLGSWQCNLSARNLVRLGFEAIDTRPCDALSAADSDWGETDSLANVPRAKFVRTASLEQGDR